MLLVVLSRVVGVWGVVNCVLYVMRVVEGVLLWVYYYYYVVSLCRCYVLVLDMQVAIILWKRTRALVLLWFCMWRVLSPFIFLMLLMCVL